MDQGLSGSVDEARSLKIDKPSTATPHARPCAIMHGCKQGCLLGQGSGFVSLGFRAWGEFGERCRGTVKVKVSYESLFQTSFLSGFLR